MLQRKLSFSYDSSVAQLHQFLPLGGKNHSRRLCYFPSNHTACPNAQLEWINFLWLNPIRPESQQHKLQQTQNRVKNAPDDSLPYHANETQVSVFARWHVSPHCNMCSLVESAQKLLRVRAKTKMDQLRQDLRRFYSCYLSPSELMDFPQEHIFVV